jgi:hypothetical protein
VHTVKSIERVHDGLGSISEKCGVFFCVWIKFEKKLHFWVLILGIMKIIFEAFSRVVSDMGCSLEQANGKCEAHCASQVEWMRL